MGKDHKDDDDVKPIADHSRDAGSDRAHGGGGDHAGASDHADDHDPHAADRSRQLAGQEVARTPAPPAQQGQQGAVAAPAQGVGAPAQGVAPTQGGGAQGGGALQAPPVPGLTKVTAPPGGTVFAEAHVDISQLAPEFRPADGTPTVGAELRVDGDKVIVHVAVGLEHWTASLSATQVAESLVGAEGLKQIGNAIEFVHSLAKRVRTTGTRVRIGLWGNAPNDSFVVLDLARIVRGVGKDTLGGFRPVEAQILINAEGKDVTGVRLFGNDAVKAETAVPGKPIGDWFPLPDVPELHAALGQDPDDKQAKHELWGGAFYADGVLRVAVKPAKDAKTGIVAHIDLAFLANKLKAFGEKVFGWIEKLLKKIAAGAVDFFKSLSLGKLRLELPDFKGTWFDFDFNLSLPKLFKGGGGGFSFDLSGLMPSGFNLDFDFGISLGAMPKLSMPWLKMPKIGGFDVPWEKLKGLLPSLPHLPSLSMPKLPSFNFGFHRIGGWKFGIGTDLSLAWPELGDLSLGFTIDLEKILEAIAGAGKWLMRKLRAAGDFINKWIHLGSDGVLRIYDKDRPDGPMLGFHLMRLLDGADGTDLAPTEIRWNEQHAGIAMELGEARDKDEEKKGDKGKGSPQKPGGLLLTQRKGIDAPEQLAKVMALADGAKIDVELHAEGDHLVVWSEAASSVYDHHQALRTSLNVKTLAQRVINKWPAGQGKPPGTSNFELDKDPTHTQAGPRINFTLPNAVGVGGAKGYALWKVEHLLRAQDWTDLAPDELQLPFGKLGAVQLGKLNYAEVGPPLGNHRFKFNNHAIAQKLLHDTNDEVFAGFHKKGDIVGVSVTKEENGEEGALAHVNLEVLLEKLKRLGDMGRRALEYLADLKLPGWRGSGGKSDVFAKIKELAARLAGALGDLVDGILELKLPGGKFIRWNLKAHLPKLSFDLDLTELIPEFDLDLPGLPNFSISLLPSGTFGNPLSGLSFKLPDVGFRDLLAKLPNVHLPKDFNVNLSWIGDLLGVSIDLGDLFGTGEKLSFGFKLPIEAMLDKLRKAGKWFGSIPGKVKDVAQYLHMGTDGVLRIFDPKNPSTRVGFDLTKLFDGVDPEDLIPVEAHAELATGTGDKKHTLAEVSYGDAYVSEADKKDAKLPDADNKHGGKHTGAVLVPRPKGNPIENATFTAPEWLREHLAAPKNARVHASLYLANDKVATFITLFAVVDGSDRGVEVKINISELTSRAKLPTTDDKGITIDKQASIGKGMLVLGVKTDKVSGHAGWKIASLLNTPGLESLLPDELVLERKEGKLTIGSEIDVSKLKHQGTFKFPNWEYIRSRIGDKSVDVYTNDFKKGDPKIALVDADDKDNKRAGIELELDHKFVVSLNTQLKKLAKQVKGAVAGALGRTGDAGQQSVLDLDIYPTGGGIMVERGKAGDEFHMYAKWGWQDLGSLMEGNVTADALMPDDFRVATKALSVEVKDLEHEVKGKPLPHSAKQVGKLHPLLKDTMTTFGLSPEQYVDLDVHSEKTKVTDEEKQMVHVHGAVYDADAQQNIAHGKSLDLDVSLSALIAQVMPQKQRAWSKKTPKDPNKKFHLTGGIELHKENGQPDGIDVYADVDRENAKGKHMEFQVRVGWTFDHILNMLMNLDQMVDADGKPNLSAAAGLLSPQRIGGFFETDDFRVDFGNNGHAGNLSAPADDIPGLGPLLGLVVDPATVAAAKIHLSLPSADQFTKSFDDAVAKVKKGDIDYKLPIGNCALELPVKDANDPTAKPSSKFYGVTLSVSPIKFKGLLQLIPGIGQYIKIADLVVGVLKDPKGALEGAMYTPEALYMVFENSGEMWGEIKKRGWKGVAMAMFVNGDMTTKQGVMAGRIYKKMKAAGWTKKGDKIPDIAGVDADYLKWLSEQDGDKLVAMSNLAEEMKNMGLDGTFDQEKPTIPAGGLPDVATINQRITEVQAGYEHYAKVQEESPNDQKALDTAANDLRKRVEKAIQAGAKPSGGVDMSDKAKSKDQPTNTKDRDYSDLTDLPVIDEQQAKIAREIFDDKDKDTGGAKDKDVVVMTVQDAQYLVNKYSRMTTDQLGEILATGHTKVTTTSGAEREIPMHEEERGFVRTLFLRRLAAEGITLGKGQASGPVNDADLVTAYRAAKSRAERDAKAKAANDASGKDGEGKGGSDEVSYEDGEGRGGGGNSLDDVFGDGAGKEQGEDKEAGKDEGGEAGVEGEKTKGEQAEDGGAAQDGETEEPKTLKDRFRPGFGEARKFVNFDTATSKAALNAEVTKGYIGGELPFKGAMYRIDAIELAAYQVSGKKDKQVYEFTIEIRVSSQATQGIPTTLSYTFIYTPSEDKISQYGSMNDVLGFQTKMNDAVDIVGETAGQKSSKARFTHEGWEMEVLEVNDVKALNVSTVDATLLIRFHKIPAPSVTVKGPDGPQLVHAGEDAYMRLPLNRDKK